MATLQELRSEIDRGKTAVLFLPGDYLGNNEKEEVKIFVSQDANGVYKSRLIDINKPLPVYPISQTYGAWQRLLDGLGEIENTSEQWELLD